MPARAGLVCVEQRGHLGSPGSERFPEPLTGGSQVASAAGTQQQAAWGCYPALEDVEALVQDLDPRGALLSGPRVSRHRLSGRNDITWLGSTAWALLQCLGLLHGV